METIAPTESAPVAAPAVPNSLAAAYNAASARVQTPAEPAPAPVKAPEPAPAKTAPPAKAATKVDALDAAAAELDDPSVTRLPFDDFQEPAEEEPATPDQRVGRVIEKLKGEIKTEWKPKVAELEETVRQKESRLAELEAFAQEREELMERVKGYEAEMSISKLEKTPAFIKEVTEPEGKIVTSAMKIIEHYGLNEKDIFAALEEPDEMKRGKLFEDALSGMDVSGRHSYEIYKLADEAQSVLNRRDQLYKNADAALAELGAHAERETTAQMAARAEERVKATDLVVARLVEKMPFMADIVRGVVEGAKSTNFEALNSQKQAYNVLMGDALPELAAKYAKIVAERDGLLDELAAYSKASPRVEGGLSRSGSNVGAPRSLAEAAAQAAGRR